VSLESVLLLRTAAHRADLCKYRPQISASSSSADRSYSHQHLVECIQQGDCSICIATRDSPIQLMHPSLILASYTIFSDLFVFLRHPRLCSERPIKSIRVRVRGTSPEGGFSWVPGGKNATEEESENVAESLEVKVYLPISNLHRLGW
jgi:hypothetical protein